MDGIKVSFRDATANWKRIVATTAVSAVVFVLFLLLTRPTYSMQLLMTNVTYLWTEIIPLLIWNQHATHGALGLLLPATIAVLAGLVAVTTGISLLANYEASGSLSGVAGSLVGFSAAGCASCGAGVLTWLGLSGGVALLPFDGLGVQAASIAIMLGALEYTGRNQTCTIDGIDPGL